MSKQVKQNERVTMEAVDAAEMLAVSGGIWDYSNRLGPYLGQQLEDRQNRKYDVVLTPKTLDEAAGMSLQGWVSIP